jgi:hypothetical protein
MTTIVALQAAILATTAYVLFFNRTLGRSLMSTQAQVDAVVAQLAKAKTEIVGKIADLQLALDDAGVADVVDVSELVAAAQALDDIVPDVPEVEDEVPAEVVGDEAEEV